MMPCDSPSIGVNSLLLLHFAGPLTPSAVRFRHVTRASTCSNATSVLPLWYPLSATISVIPFTLRTCVASGLFSASRSINSPSPRRLRPAFRALWWCRLTAPCSVTAITTPLSMSTACSALLAICVQPSFIFAIHASASVALLHSLFDPFLLAPDQAAPDSSRVGVEIPLFLAKSVRKASVPLAVIASHDGSHRCVSFQCRRIHTDDLALQQATISQHTQHPAEYLPVRLNVDQTDGFGKWSNDRACSHLNRFAGTGEDPRNRLLATRSLVPNRFPRSNQSEVIGNTFPESATGGRCYRHA